MCIRDRGKEYETLNLTDYKIGSYGQKLEGDELGQVIAKMKQAEVIVIGSPLYWHNICGSVRNILDRFYGLVENGSLSGRTLYFLFQGASPEKWMLEAGEYTICLLYTSTMAENRIIKLGKRMDFECHQMEHQLGAYTNCNHGEGLAVLHPCHIACALSAPAICLCCCCRCSGRRRVLTLPTLHP